MSEIEATGELSLHGAPARYGGGLREVAPGVHAWLQPNGGLGESNAGLIVGDGESLLVDTLWDLPLTRRMLAAMEPLTASAPVHTIVNTHGDGDHCWGNQLVPGARIVATRAAASDMRDEEPRTLRMIGSAGERFGGAAERTLGGLAGKAGRLAGRGRLADLAATGARLGAGRLAGLAGFASQLTPFDFSDIEVTLPTRTFQERFELDVGGRKVELIEVGPAHTPGDLIVHVPDARVVFAADVLFVGVTPIMWTGPVERWLAALWRIDELEPTVVVPGHGPLSDRDGVAAMRRYWEWVAPAVRERLSTGMGAGDAAREILAGEDFAAQEFSSWDGAERLHVNAALIERGDRGEGGRRVDPRTRAALLAGMGELAREPAE